MLHEFQVVSEDAPVLLDNGACAGHPLFDEDPAGCSIGWLSQGARLTVEDIIFIDPACPHECFPDAELCAQTCAVASPAGWNVDPAPSQGTFAFDVPGCEIPDGVWRYVIELKDQLIPMSPPIYWDPLTPVTVDDEPVLNLP